MVLAQSLFKILARRHLDAVIDVLAPAWSLPLLARMPEVHEALAMPLGHGQLGLQARFRLGRQLLDRRYDQAILLPNSWKSALTPFWAKIPHRTGYLGEVRWGLLNDVRRLDKARLPMTVQRFVALGLEAGLPLPTPLPTPSLLVDPAAVTAALERLGLTAPPGPLLGLCPGAEYGPAKRWPPEHFAAIARDRLAAGWTVWLFGSAKDIPVGQAISTQLDGRGVDLSGRTSLAEAVDLLSLTTAVVSNDSGLMHVAAALGRPLVALYGSSDPGFTPPLSPQAQILSLPLECRPCFQRECPLGHLRCLRDLGPEQVLAALKQAQA
jgi:heptosyltransferase-2